MIKEEHRHPFVSRLRNKRLKDLTDNVGAYS